MGFVNEFKAFVMRGNVMDLAVGVIIGAAFAKIVSSLVDNILMPVIGIFLKGVDFQGLSVKVGAAEIKYGMFIGAIFDFLIIAAILFVLIKAVNNMQKKQPPAPAPPTKDQALLTEIRDLLKK